MKQCNHCRRFSESITGGGSCPWCGHKNTALDSVWPWVLGGVLTGVVALAAVLLVR